MTHLRSGSLEADPEARAPGKVIYQLLSEETSTGIEGFRIRKEKTLSKSEL